MSTQLVSHMDLTDKVDRIMKHLHVGSSSFPDPTAGPSTSSPASGSFSPSFTFPSPHIPPSSPTPSTPRTVILPSPSTLASEAIPSSSTPATVILPSLLNPPTVPFDDDKGGEKSKE